MNCVCRRRGTRDAQLAVFVSIGLQPELIYKHKPWGSTRDRQTDRATGRQRRSAGGRGCCLWWGLWEQKAPRLLLLLLLKERVKREKEIEDGRARESERVRERLLALLALLQRMMSWSMTSPCSVITAPPPPPPPPTPSFPASHSLILSLHTP